MKYLFTMTLLAETFTHVDIGCGPLPWAPDCTWTWVWLNRLYRHPLTLLTVATSNNLLRVTQSLLAELTSKYKAINGDVLTVTLKKYIKLTSGHLFMWTADRTADVRKWSRQESTKCSSRPCQKSKAFFIDGVHKEMVQIGESTFIFIYYKYKKVGLVKKNFYDCPYGWVNKDKHHTTPQILMKRNFNVF